MSSAPGSIHFGPFEVTSQVFLTTQHSHALVNIKPLMPGHVLVIPHRPHERLTDLSPPEVADLFATVQRVERMLARHYFGRRQHQHQHQQPPAPAAAVKNGPGLLDVSTTTTTLPPLGGSFNIALQDGPEAGQTVAHVHVHVIPRIRGVSAKPAETPSDELYERMAGEDGNVGGAQWDAAAALPRERPRPGGRFPRVEDEQRVARGLGEMEAEAEVFRAVLRDMEGES